MSNGRIKRFESSPFTAGGCSWFSSRRPHALGYRQILAPTSLNVADRAALVLGFELAALHQAALTLLHVLPPPRRKRDCSGLDAFGLLHEAADELQGNKNAGMPPETAQRKLHEYLEDIVSAHLREAVNWRVECRWGDFGATTAAYANEAAADVVIVGAPPPPWWLPIMPAAVRIIERRARAKVIVVRDQAPSRPASQGHGIPCGLKNSAVLALFSRLVQ